MNDATPQRDTDPADAVVGHEPSEVGIRRIFVFGGALAALTVVVLTVLGGVMRTFAAREKADGTTTRDLVAERPGDFPAPRLQTNTTFDMVEFRRQEDAALNSYGWVDPGAGVAQIPIDRAIDLLARNGLPRPKPQEKPAAPETKPAPPANRPGTEPGKKD